MKTSNKFLLASFGGLSLFLVTTIAVSNNDFALIKGTADSDPYTIVMDSTNRYTSGDSNTVYTTRTHYPMTFTYSSATASSGNHVSLSSGGFIVNQTYIKSVSNITVNYTGSNIKLYSSYDGVTYSTGSTIASGAKIELNLPYFVKIENSGSSSTTISSIVIEHTCSVNQTAEDAIANAGQQSEQEVTVDDTLTRATTGVTSGSTSYKSWSGKTLTSDAVYAGLSAGANDSIQIRSKDSNSGVITTASGGKISKVIVSWNSNTQNGRTLDVYGKNSAYSSASDLFTSSKGDKLGSIVYGTSTELTISGDYSFVGVRSAADPMYLESITFRWTTTESSATPTPTPDDPTAYEVGFTASLSKTEYKNDETFSTSSVSVVANMSDGTSNPVSYSTLVVKDTNNNAIDITKTFENNSGYAEGVYKVIVGYKDFIPQEFNINVSTRVVITSVAADTTKLTYTTAETLDTSKVTANITYNKGEPLNGISYTEFATNGLALQLFNPNNVAHNIANIFGVAGTWTIKVYSTADSTKYGEVQITVNAIPVQSISLSESSATIEEGKTLQLTATVNPGTATNPAYTWESSNEKIATVSDSGLVKAISSGEATISAISDADNSIAGTCVITVTPRVSGADEGTYTLATSGLTVGHYVIFANPVSNGSGYAMGSQNTNNRAAVAAEFSNGTIERDTSSTYRAYLVKDGLTSGTISFYDETDEGYLYAASSSSNWLRTESTLTSNSSFTVSGAEGKTITASGGNSRNLLRFNSSSKIFSCYQSGQANPYIYEKAGNPVYPTAITLSGSQSIGVGEATQLSVAYTPSNTTVKTISYESSNDLVATVSSSGVVTGIKAGTTTITATAYGGLTSSLQITVSNIAVSSVTLNKSSTTLTVGGTETLTATINPSNATNKNVTWSTSDNSVATVDAGVVTAIGAGTANITVTSQADSTKKATCAVTVNASGGGSSGADTIDYNDTSTPLSGTGESGWQEFTVSKTVADYYIRSMGISGTDALKWNANGYFYTSSVTSGYTISSVSVNATAGKTVNLYFSNSKMTSAGSGSESGSITGNGSYSVTGSYSYVYIKGTASSTYITSITVTYGTPTPKDPTGIAVTPSSLQLAKNGSQTLSVTYTPSDANQNKAITWSSNNTSVATVDTSGKVTVSANAGVGSTATITAKLTNIQSITATCTVTVVEQSKADQTVLIYICGSNLESDYASSNQGLATGDIQEILQVSGQPDDVNIVIETGGANSWSSRYGISASNLQRYHVANKKLVLDESLSYASMGLTSTLQSFVKYGFDNYDAQRMSLVLWNHGGAMRGVCYDEKKNDDNLLNTEVQSAITNALPSGRKLDWIGYDACLMQVQDIAEMNSAYAGYMIASEESEAGYGWDYNTWVDDLYAKKSTPVILKAIVDGFIADNGGASSSSNDQTLSYLDLSYASAYKTAWENMSTQLKNKITTSNKSNFNNLVKSCKHYADSDYTYYGTFDAKDFINKLSSNSTFNPGSTYTSAVLTAFDNFVAYSSCGKGAGESYGLCMFWAVSSSTSKGTYYKESMTNFTTWRSIVVSYGN